jgi:hypothetical protein
MLVPVLAFLMGCQPRSAEPEGRPSEPYVPSAGSVKLDILPVQSHEGSRTWLATYSDEGGTTKFRIALGPVTQSGDKGLPLSSGRGEFLSEPGSDPLPLLRSLKRALEAKRMPANVRKVETLAFDYMILGENQSRSAAGSFSDQPKGDWTATKIVLAKGGEPGEVYLNLDPVAHLAEFSLKSRDYGDTVLAQLAKVL